MNVTALWVIQRPAALRVTRPELIVGTGVGLVAFAMYLVTLAPGLTWSNLGGDGGDLLTAAFTWGIPHPSGYPTYLLLLRVFSFVFPFGDEAFRGNLFSALLAAAAAGLIYIAALRVIDLLPRARPLPGWTSHAAAVVAGLSVAFSRELWSQAVITEVYALNAFFLSVLMLGLVALYQRERDGGPSTWLRRGLALLLGVGLGNHLTLGLTAAPFVAWSYFWLGGWEGARLRLRDVGAPLALLLGLSVYAYAPIASSGRPLLNWGHPDTAQGFWWMISGSIYQNYAFGVEAGDILSRIAQTGDLLLAQFGFIGLLLGVVGLTLLWEAWRGFAVAGMVSVLLVAGYAIAYDTPDSFLYLIPPFMLVALWLSGGTVALFAALAGLREKALAVSLRSRWQNGSSTAVRRGLARRMGFEAIRRLPGLERLLAGAFALLLIAIPGFSAFANFGGLNLRDDREAIRFAQGAFETASPGSVVAASGASEIFSLWYQSYVAAPEADVLVISVPHLQFDWYWDDLRMQAPERLPDERPIGFFDRVFAVVDHNLGTREVYVAGEQPLYEDRFRLVEAGPLRRVLP